MMKKQNIFCWALLLGSLLTGGCVSTVHEPAEEATPISFATTATRGAVNQDKTGMENFLVWGGFDDQNNLFDAEEIQATGTYHGTRYWVPGKTHHFHALHPASLAKSVSCLAEHPKVINIKDFDTSAQRGLEAVDLMTATPTEILFSPGSTPSSVSLGFQHELSRVRFTIHTDAKVTITDVKLWGIAYQGNFTSQPDAPTPWHPTIKATEEKTPFQERTPIILEAQGSRHLLAGVPDKNDNYGDLLLIPQTIDLKSVYFTMSWSYENGYSRTVRVPLAETGAKVWEKGKSYQYSATIPVQTSEMSFTVKVSQWNIQKVNVDLE